MTKLNKIMRRLFLAIVLLAFGMNAIHAQLNHVSIGYGPTSFPVANQEIPDGGAAYLSIGFEDDRVRTIGGTLFIAGNSRIKYAGEEVGYGAVGLTGFGEMNITRNGLIRAGLFVGGIVYQKYESRDLFKGTEAEGLGGFGSIQPELKDTNFQPFGGFKLGIGPVEVQYAPVSKTLTFGVRLYKG